MPTRKYEIHKNAFVAVQPNKIEYKIKPAFPWPGGKTRLLKYIQPRIPKHTCYCEAFAGGLAVLLAKPRSEVEVVNDINGDLVTFYRCVRFHAEPLIAELEFALHSRQEFRDFREQPGLTDIQRAARWYYRHRECFRSVGLDTFGTSPTTAKDSRAARMESIRQINVRLDRVVVENLTWEKCLGTYDRPTTFFYLDPPYTGGDIDVYAAWQTSDVLRFRERLDRLKGSWLVSLNDTPDIRKIFSDCEVQYIERSRGITADKKRYRELLIAPPKG